jgi:hypothetical protein
MMNIETAKQIQSQQVTADAVLRMMFVIDPNSCILGGAPRDWALGNPAKDLDVYIQTAVGEPSEITMKRIMLAMDLQEDEIEDITSSSYYVAGIDNGVQYVFNIKNCYMPIQVIVCDRKPIKMLDVFHGSLSKVSYVRLADWDPFDNYAKTGIETTMEFDISKKFQVHMVYAKDDMRYINKVTAKYPYFTTVYEA